MYLCEGEGVLPGLSALEGDVGRGGGEGEDPEAAQDGGEAGGVHRLAPQQLPGPGGLLRHCQPQGNRELEQLVLLLRRALLLICTNAEKLSLFNLLMVYKLPSIPKNNNVAEYC